MRAVYSKVPDDTGAGCGARSASMAGRFHAVGVTIQPRTRLSFHYVREGIARNDVSISLEKCKPGQGYLLLLSTPNLSKFEIRSSGGSTSVFQERLLSL